ncbi:MAG: hypothetical protein ACLS54_08900 [Anaerostipes hadrus]
MSICKENREEWREEIILEKTGMSTEESFHTIHNATLTQKK